MADLALSRGFALGSISEVDRWWWREWIVERCKVRLLWWLRIAEWIFLLRLEGELGVKVSVKGSSVLLSSGSLSSSSVT